jgi:hypothetical protein
MSRSIADRMAEAAEEDRSLPYSLVLDALDAMDFGGMEPLIRTFFERDLVAALDRYEADQLGYWTEERIAREYGDADFYVDAAHRDGDHASCTHN